MENEDSECLKLSKFLSKENARIKTNWESRHRRSGAVRILEQEKREDRDDLRKKYNKSSEGLELSEF